MVQKASGLFVRDTPKPFVVRRMLFGAVFGNEIGHARAGDRGFEAGGLGDDPFAHVAAVGPAADSEAIGVGNSFGDKAVDAAHHALLISAAPIAPLAFPD